MRIEYGQKCEKVGTRAVTLSLGTGIRRARSNKRLSTASIAHCEYDHSNMPGSSDRAIKFAMALGEIYINPPRP